MAKKYPKLRDKMPAERQKRNKQRADKLSEEDEQLKKLAFDIFCGHVFTDRHVKHPSDMPLVFVPLMLLTGELAKKLADDPPGLIYQYYDEAGPRSVNGMPIFFSFRYLSKEKTARMFQFYEQFKQMKDQIK